jgi:predicted AAA+ superfamily ATPase
MLEIGDERTLKLYLQYLEEAGLILLAPRGKTGFGALRKPEKIYLNNPTLVHALALPLQPDQGSLRETFFFNMVANSYPVSIPRRGDFLVDDRLIFEIGDKNNDFQQIKDLPDSFLAVDHIESGYGARIPLWLFGFLY